MPTRLYKKNQKAVAEYEYKLTFWSDFDYEFLKFILIRTKKNHKKTTYADVIMMADTETSKKPKLWISKKKERKDNHIVAWSLSIRAYGYNIVTLWGQDPFDMMKCIQNILKYMPADEVYLYFHNMAYDWVFLRKFFFVYFGLPKDQLNTKPLYPLYIKFNNGLILKDSLILAQRKLEKWALDMDVEHKKAVGFWEYDKLRNQSDKLSPEELQYIECDVLAGVECIDKTMEMLKCNISTIPYTATGIVRNEARRIGKKHKAHDWFRRVQPEDYHTQRVLEQLFNGGYTHNNRFNCDQIFEAECYDESSAYPFAVLTEKMPAEKFWKLKKPIDPAYVFKNPDYAFIFLVKIANVKLLDLHYPMPYLSLAKCQVCLNNVSDNGRIIKADYVEIDMNEIDLALFIYQYDYSSIELTEVMCAYKDYLPRWFTDYIYERYRLKTQLKGKDKVLYQIEKAKLNAGAYGMAAQRPVRQKIVEDYETGEYSIDEEEKPEALYKKYLENYNSFLPYTMGVWITSAARRNLFRVGSCVADDGIWLYSDTDSVYATKFNMKKIEAYNKECIKKLEDRGYPGVEFEGKLYYTGVVELDGVYSEWKGLHSKCYCCRDKESGKLKITVAGVPKAGVASLHDDINEFKLYKIFDGKTSGKLQHEHIFVDEIYTDENGNITGDSIDLSSCDYVIGDANIPDPADYMEEDIEVRVYDEE